MNYFRTVRSFFRQSYVNPYAALGRHTGWQIRKLANAFPHDVRLGRARIRVADRSVANGCGAQLNALGYYDPNNMHFLMELFGARTMRTFFDVGANIGVYSLIVATRRHDVQVAAFEPHPGTFALLEENVQLNGAGDRVQCFNLALGDKDGSMRLVDRAGNPTNRILQEGEDAAEWVGVAMRRGDSVSATLQMVPDALKIDVEGFENAVLTGFGSVLPQTGVIFVEARQLDTTVATLRGLADFAGPWKIDFRKRRFIEARVHDEDWLFLNRARLDAFQEWMH